MNWPNEPRPQGRPPSTVVEAGALEAIPSPAALVDARGILIATNRAWGALATRLAYLPPFVRPGTSWLGKSGGLWQNAPDDADVELRRLLQGHRAHWHATLRTDLGVLGDLRIARNGTGALVVLDKHPNHEGIDPLDSFFELSLDMLCVASAEGTFTRVNHAFTTSLGYREEELLSRPFLEFVHEEDRERTVRAMTQLNSGQQVFAFVNRYRTADGRYRWFQWYAAPADANRNIYAVARDVTDQKRFEERLMRSEAHLRNAQEVAHVGSFELSIGGGEDLWSPEAFRIVRRAQEAGPLPLAETIERYVHPEDRARVRAAAEAAVGSGTEFAVDFRVVREDGEIREVHCVGEPRRGPGGRETTLLGTLQDVTETRRAEADRKALELQLRQSQKLEAVGQLAGSIAHDFNNILTAVLGYAELIRDQLERGSTKAEHATPHPATQSILGSIGQIERASHRAADLIHKLLTFSRRRASQQQVLEVNTVVDEVLPMLQRLLTENIALRFDRDPAAGHVHVDAGQLEQVLLNLIVNAQDAMRGSSGQLTIRTGQVEYDATAAARARVAPGPFVRLEVSDTGTGMPPEVRERIFEPFFTTKAPGRGTGLGLSTVHGIVRGSGGTIDVDSEPGVGTTFRIDLPRVPAPAAVAPPPPPTASTTSGGAETVLVCEDEDAVRVLLERILTSAGYRVLLAPNAEEALSQAKAHPGRIDLLVTDVILPGLHGRELAASIVQMHPEARTLFVSGYAAEQFESEAPDLLEKPFTRSSLLTRVRERLDATV